MRQGARFRQRKRLARIMSLLKRLRTSSMPVTYRRNRVTLYHDGGQFFEALLEAIRGATCCLLLEYYLIRNDHTGTALAMELAAAVRRGVRVMLIYDYIGCVDTPSTYFKSLARSGIELLPFNVPSFKRGVGWFDRRDHRKMTIVDHSLAFLGGCNIGDEYAGLARRSHRFRDVGFSVAGSAVSELIRLFCETWQMERGEYPSVEPLARQNLASRHYGRANVVMVSGGPHHRSSYIRSAFLLSIASASEEILITTPYFVPGPRIMRSLIRAVRRGVRVCLLLPARSDVPMVRLLGRSFYGALLDKGIEIYELEEEILHAKVMLIDGEQAVIGSANLDQRSFHRNFEINAVIGSTTFGGQIRAMLKDQFQQSRRITLEDHERRGRLARVLERVINLFGWFL